MVVEWCTHERVGLHELSGRFLSSGTECIHVALVK